MLGTIAHIGITVSNMDKAIEFYKEILELQLMGDMTMGGPETEALTQIKDAKLRVVYFNSNKDLTAPPIELIEFIGIKEHGTPYARLSNIGISEVCFNVEDIESTYKRLKAKGVKFLSKPQYFDLSNQGFGKSKAVYFKDCDGTVLELIQYV